MPIYEYECTTCGKRFEIKRKFSDPPILSCKAFACLKDEPVNKLISAPAIVFKGSGWYVTDYSDKLKNPHEPPAEGKAGGKAGGEKAGEAKAGEAKTGEAKASNGSASESSSISHESHGSSSQSASASTRSAGSSPSPPSSTAEQST